MKIDLRRRARARSHRVRGASAIGAAPSEENIEATNEENTLHAIVLGRVQGVGFRYYVLDVARPLDIAGTVRNRRDGTVEVLARGTTSRLESLVARLREGPPMSRVTDVRVEWGVADVPDGPGEGFSISH